MPSPRKIETPSGSHVPNGCGRPASGSPSSRPISRPMRRPATAVTNSAVESCSTSRMSQVAGTIVRYGRTPNPTTPQATTHSATSAPAASKSLEQAVAGRRQDEPDRPAEQGAQDTDVTDQRLPRGLTRRPDHEERYARGGQPSIVATASPRRARPSAEGLRDRVGERADDDELHPGDLRRRARRAAGRGHDRAAEPEPGGLAQPALEAGDRPQLAEQADLADRDGARRRPAGRGATTRAPGRAAGPARARRRSGRRRGWRRRRGRPGRSRPAGRGRRRAGSAGSGRGRWRAGRATRSGPRTRAPGPRPGAAGCPRASARRRCPGAGSSCSARNARAGSATSAETRRRPSRRPRPRRSTRTGSSTRAAGAATA